MRLPLCKFLIQIFFQASQIFITVQLICRMLIIMKKLKFHLICPNNSCKQCIQSLRLQDVYKRQMFLLVGSTMALSIPAFIARTINAWLIFFLTGSPKEMLESPLVIWISGYSYLILLQLSLIHILG